MKKILSVMLAFAIALMVPPASAKSGEEPWRENVLKEDFLVSDYAMKRYAVEHVVFNDSLKSLQDAVSEPLDVSQAQDGSVLAWFTGGHIHGKYPSYFEYSCQYTLHIGAEGGVNAALACENMFADCTELRYIDFNDSFHTEGAVSMEKMFFNCTHLIRLDVTCLDTSSVTTMNAMFYGLNNSCQLTIDLERFDTSHVTDYNRFMYYGDEIDGTPWIDLFEKGSES